MTDLLEATQTDSTVIDTDIQGTKSGGGKPSAPPPEAPRKPESVRDSLEAEAKKLEPAKDEDEDNDNEDKPVAEKKEPEKTAKEVKPAEAEKSEAKAKDESGQEVKTPKPSEGRKIIEAPARLLPQNRELWKGVAHPIREEWVRREQEHEQEISQYREAKQFREDVREFEELAQKQNVPFKQVLTNYVDIERKFSEDPAQGFRQLCQNLNISPPQAIGHILRSANVTPQQLIEHMQREPSAYTSLAQQRQQAQQQPQQRQPDPELESLKQQFQALQAERVAESVIKPFANQYPEYYDHEDAIAKVLQSGIIDQIHGSNLSPRDKLEAALFMVAPQIKRGSMVDTDQDNSVRDDERGSAPAGDLRGGNKSVKSSFGDVNDVVETQKKGQSIREMLEEESRKIGRRAS